MKKVPLRRCIGCRNSFEKNELIRVVRTPDNQIILDEKGKANGRGAYVCKNKECVENAFKKNQFEYAFGVKIPGEEKERIKELISGKISGNENVIN